MRKLTVGFTLIELMVAITIVAILSAIGFVTYSGIQKNARDTIRQAQIGAIATAIEASKNPSTGIYYFTATSLQNEFPATETRPRTGLDPKDFPYCVRTDTNASATLTNAVNDLSWTLTACGSSYSRLIDAIGVTGGLGANSAKSWILCARLESRTDVYCISSKSN